jgi:hypothetical protein
MRRTGGFPRLEPAVHLTCHLNGKPVERAGGVRARRVPEGMLSQALWPAR